MKKVGGYVFFAFLFLVVGLSVWGIVFALLAKPVFWVLAIISSVMFVSTICLIVEMIRLINLINRALQMENTDAQGAGEVVEN